MDRVRFIEHKGRQVLMADLSGLRDPDEMIAVMEASRPVIDGQPPKSLLLLTNCIDTHYEAKGAEAIKQWSKQNTPFVKASVVTGVVGLKRILFQAVIKLTGRNIAALDTVDQALD
ncbi:hypothetical protein EG831_05325, partial [bacterium]|nr:hypothetical protein [bacterium]